MVARVLCESADLIVPAEDRRAHRLIELPNGLRALLVQDASMTAPDDVAVARPGCGSCLRPRQQTVEVDPATDGASKLAACALCVGVGYLNDPPQLQGCAHYVEQHVHRA